MDDRRPLLDRTAALAGDFLNRLPERPVGLPVDLDRLRADFGGPLPERPSDPEGVIEALGGDADTAMTDDFTRRVIAAVQADGTCWLGGTTWHGMAAMRISVSNWSTTEADADQSVEAILRCAREVAVTEGARA